MTPSTSSDPTNRRECPNGGVSQVLRSGYIGNVPTPRLFLSFPSQHVATQTLLLTNSAWCSQPPGSSSTQPNVAKRVGGSWNPQAGRHKKSSECANKWLVCKAGCCAKKQNLRPHSVNGVFGVFS